MFHHPQRLTCEVCAAVFTGRDGLVRHRRTKHGSIVSTCRKIIFVFVFVFVFPDCVAVELGLCWDFYLVVTVLFLHLVTFSWYYYFIVVFYYNFPVAILVKDPLIRIIQT